jgi:hypothetical protein
MSKNCGACSGVILSGETYWKVGETFLHPGDCYWTYKRKQKVQNWPNTVFKVVFTAIVLCTLSAYAEQPNPGDPKTDQKGCICTYNGGNGKFYFEAFIKTADKETLDENGESEIWGFNVEPGNLELVHEIRDGKVIPVNEKASRWIPADGRLHDVQAGSTKRKVKCPPYW